MFVEIKDQIGKIEIVKTYIVSLEEIEIRKKGNIEKTTNINILGQKPINVKLPINKVKETILQDTLEGKMINSLTKENKELKEQINKLKIELGKYKKDNEITDSKKEVPTKKVKPNEKSS